MSIRDLISEMVPFMLSTENLGQEITHLPEDGPEDTITAVVAVDPGDVFADDAGRTINRRLRITAAADGFEPTKDSRFRVNGSEYAAQSIDGDEFMTTVSATFTRRLNIGAVGR